MVKYITWITVFSRNRVNHSQCIRATNDHLGLVLISLINWEEEHGREDGREASMKESSDRV